MFGPAQAGKYYFYSLPFEKQGGWGGYVRDYLPQETAPADVMDHQNYIAAKNHGEYVHATCLEIHVSTSFDSFYPMEVTATETEKKTLATSHSNQKFLLFPEDRKYPIRMPDNSHDIYKV